MMYALAIGWDVEWAMGLTFFGIWGICLSFAIFGLNHGHMASRVCAYLLMAYILVYAALSLRGRYQPAAIGLAGVKWYSWAPYGFYDAEHPWPGARAAREHPEQKTGDWRESMMISFLPLWIVDTHYIHREP
jgi:hypothetical protein